jgi:hypothetical protein
LLLLLVPATAGATTSVGYFPRCATATVTARLALLLPLLLLNKTACVSADASGGCFQYCYGLRYCCCRLVVCLAVLLARLMAAAATAAAAMLASAMLFQAPPLLLLLLLLLLLATSRRCCCCRLGLAGSFLLTFVLVALAQRFLLWTVLLVLWVLDGIGDPHDLKFTRVESSIRLEEDF